MKLGIRELLFVCVVIGLLACTYLFVFRRSEARRADLRAEIERKQSALENLHQATVGVDDLNKMVAELGQAIKFFDSKLPQEREVDKILKEVWQLAGANALVTLQVKTEKAQTNATYNELPITMSLSGNFYGYYAFLQQLEKLPRITRVTKMKLTKINDQDGFMSANMTLSIFFEPANKAVASAN